jgi:hypothetical protein
MVEALRAAGASWPDPSTPNGRKTDELLTQAAKQRRCRKLVFPHHASRLE